MWKRLFDWHSRHSYRNQLNRIQRCQFYAIGEFGLAIPVISIAVTFPEEPFLTNLSTNLLDQKAIGESVVAALDYAGCMQNHAVPEDYTSIQAGFLRGMDRYRKSIGVGKRRFESQMQMISISRKEGELQFNKSERSHGRFAFEDTRQPNGQIIVRGAVNMDKIGQSVLTLLGKQFEDFDGLSTVKG